MSNQIDPGYADPRADPQTQACLRLWAAVFHAGMEDAAIALKCGMVDDPAYIWFYDDINRPGSFVWLCDLFDICPEVARDKARMRFRKLAKRKRGQSKNAQLAA